MTRTWSSDRHPWRGVVLLVVVVAASLIALISYDLHREFTGAIEGARSRTQNLTRVLEEHARQSLRRVELTLTRAADEFRGAHGAPGADGGGLQQRLRGLLPSDGLIRAFEVADRDGAIMLSTLSGNVRGRPAVADRDYFVAHRDYIDIGMLIGATFKSPTDGHWRIPISVRLATPEGAFQGVLLALVEPAYFQNFYDSIDTGANGFVTMFLRQGWIAARSPFNESVLSRNWSDSPMFRVHLPAADVGTVRQIVVADGVERIYSYRALKDYPVIVSLGLSLTEVLTPWRARAWRDGILLLIALTALAGAARALAQQLKRRAAAESALRASEAKFRAVAQFSWDGFQLQGPDRRITFVSPSATRILGYQPEEMVGNITAAFLHPEDVERTAGVMKSLLNNPGGTVVAQVRLRHKDGSWRWVESSATNLLAHPDVRAIAVNYRDITEQRTQQEKIQRLNRVYAVLGGINAAIMRIRDRDELFREAVRIAVENGGLLFAWLGVVDREAMEMKLVAWYGGDQDYVDGVRRRSSLRLDVPDGPGIIAQAVSGKRAIVANDVANDPRVRLQQESAKLGIRALAVFPLLVADEIAAVLTLHSADVGYFDDQEMKLLLELAGDIAFAMGHIRDVEKLDYLAYYDSLTGLANRTLFIERLGQYLHTAGQAGDKLALVVADVERLRNINDSLGRQTGDALLKALADRLALGADRTELARIGADQYAIVLQDVMGRSAVTRRFERMWQDCFGVPYMVDGTELRIAGKAGIVLFPNDGIDAETLLRNAEAALRQAKKTGERHVFHATAMTEHTAEKLSLENRLRQALEKGEFVLHYQPKVDVEKRHLVGVEALIRWQSPELGLVPPLRFIPLMEETGMILETGAWAMSQAVRDHGRWLELGLPAPRVAVNVSAVQLRKKDYLATLAEALQRGATPTGIDLEITESLVMDDIQGNIEKLKEVRKLGVSIAIDDFGTGYSSLGYLAKLPVQTLKIDRSFIITMLAEPDTMTLVSTIISLAHSLKLKVVAEGVESEEQAKMLRLLRCDEMQGYLYSRPVPFDEITALLRKG